MKNFVVNPIGLKGKEIHERQLSLMGINLITENKNDKKSAVELTKIGPDGNAYAIVRENHEYYIKKSNKTNGLVLEDFKYIGGLQNKKEAAYPSYAKAIKQLNLKFKSLAEAYNKGGDINVFEDDNLLSESAFGMGFSNQGNMEGMDEMWAEETVSEYDKKAMQNFIDQYGEEKGKQIYYATANKEDRNPETFEKTDEEIEMNEYEMAIDEMINSLNNEGTDPEDDFYPDAPFRNEEHSKLSDPSKKEMLDTLKQEFGGFEGYDGFSAEEAIYWYAYDYHGGQYSNLYSALSTSKYKPSPLMKGAEDIDDDMTVEMYNTLVDKFGGEEIGLGDSDYDENLYEKLDAVGHEDGDINNDGKEDSQDDYLLNKREKIAKNIDEEMSDKQKKIAALAGDKKEFGADDLKALRAGAKLKEIDAIFEGIKSFDDIIGEYDGLKKKL